MKTYEAFNKIFDANDSLRKQTIDIFMEKNKRLHDSNRTHEIPMVRTL